MHFLAKSMTPRPPPSPLWHEAVQSQAEANQSSTTSVSVTNNKVCSNHAYKPPSYGTYKRPTMPKSGTRHWRWCKVMCKAWRPKLFNVKLPPPLNSSSSRASS